MDKRNVAILIIIPRKEKNVWWVHQNFGNRCLIFRFCLGWARDHENVGNNNGPKGKKTRSSDSPGKPHRTMDQMVQHDGVYDTADRGTYRN